MYLNCEFDFRFLFVDKNISRIENFEIEYVNKKDGITGLTEFEVDLTGVDLGVWKYFIQWNTLGELTANTLGNTYLSVDGSARIWGWFFGITGTTPIIRHITSKIYNRFDPSADGSNRNS